MKFCSRLLALLLAMLLAVSAFSALTVSATEEDEYQYTKEEVEMYASLLGMSYEDTLDYLGLSEADLAEGSILSSSDAPAVYSYTDMLAGLDFVTRTTSSYGISYKLPKESAIYSPETDELVIVNALETTKKDLMNNYFVVDMAEYTDPLTQAVVYYQISAEENTPYGNHIGNFNDLSVDEQNSLIELKVSDGYDKSNTYTVRRDGQLYLIARTDADYMSESGLCTTEVDITTVINGVYYNAYLYVQHGGTEADKNIVDDLINSFRVKGIVTQADANKTIAIIALCLAGVLLIVVGFLVFFIIRFSIFSKASGSKFNIIGFNMPEKITANAVSKHSFRTESSLSDSAEEDDID